MKRGNVCVNSAHNQGKCSTFVGYMYIHNNNVRSVFNKIKCAYAQKAGEDDIPA